MTVIRWRPMRNPFNLQHHMNRRFEGVLDETFDQENGGVWSPATDVTETKDSLIVWVELPGMKREDIKVSVGNNILSIRGERRQVNEEESNYHRTERSYGAFSRIFKLPFTVLADQIKANYENGLLKVLLPKVETVKPREIAVQVG